MEKEGGKGVMRFYSSLYQALRDVYPNFNWEASRFISEGGRIPAGHWNDETNMDAAFKKAEQKLGIITVCNPNPSLYHVLTC